MDESSQIPDNRQGEAATTQPVPVLQLQHKAKVLQPSQALIDEMAAAKVEEDKAAQTSVPPTPASSSPQTQPASDEAPGAPQLTTPPADPQPKSGPSAIYPDMVHGTGVVGNQTMESGEKEYDPSNKKVYERVPSLQIYAIVQLVLNILGLLSVITLVSDAINFHESSLLITTEFIRDVTYGLPVLASVIFLTSKSVALVKALLIVILIGYVVSIVNLSLMIFSLHVTVSFSPVILVGIIISLIFLAWTWSVFSDVNRLTRS